MIVRIVLYVVASWLMAAHFLRGGDLILVVLCLATPALFLVRRRWSLTVLEALSYAAGLVWLITAWQIAETRRLMGEPWLRAVLILVGVAAFSALAGFLLRGLRPRYAQEPGPEEAGPDDGRP